MSKRPQEQKPADKQASIPAMSKIEAERKSAIGVQVRLAVEEVLTKGRSVSGTQLQKWGPDGTGYFFRVLRRRIAKEMSELPQAGAAAPALKSVKARPSNGANKPTPQKADATVGKSNMLPVSTDRNWTDRQHNRRSIRTHAVRLGLITTVPLFVGAAVIMRQWDTLTQLFLQFIQNWK